MDSQMISPRAAKKRKAILDAAWSILVQEGYARASVDAVLAVCGGSKATIYSYFKSKEELFGQAMFARSTELADDVFHTFVEGDELTDTLYKFGRRYLSFYLNSELLEATRLATAEGKNLHFGRVFYKEGFQKNWEKVAAYLEKHIPPENLLEGQGWRAAMHLKGLLDGETLLKRIWGASEQITADEIDSVVETAIIAFKRIYAFK